MAMHNLRKVHYLSLFFYQTDWSYFLKRTSSFVISFWEDILKGLE